MDEEIFNSENKKKVGEKKKIKQVPTHLVCPYLKIDQRLISAVIGQILLTVNSVPGCQVREPDMIAEQSGDMLENK